LRPLFAGRFNENSFTEPGSSYEYTRPLLCQSYRNYIHLRRHLRRLRMGSLGCQGLQAGEKLKKLNDK